MVVAVTWRMEKLPSVTPSVEIAAAQLFPPVLWMVRWRISALMLPAVMKPLGMELPPQAQVRVVTA